MLRSMSAAIMMFATAASAQDIPAVDVAAPSGLIVMYRGSGIVGAAVACPIRHKGNEVVELGRGKYAEWPVEAGRYILTNKTASVEVSVAPGETRFVRCQIKAGFMSGRADLQLVDGESFEAAKPNLERKEIAAR